MLVLTSLVLLQLTLARGLTTAARAREASIPEPPPGEAFFEDASYNKGLYGQYVTQSFKSSNITAPRLNMQKPFTNCDDGSYLFLTPRGYEVAVPTVAIYDASGSLIWSPDADFGQVYNFQVQMYKGKPYLFFWGGNDSVGGHGSGFYYMYDQHYQLVKTIAAANGLGADLHSFSILPSGNALISVYDAVEINGEWIWDCLFQEIDIESSELIYEWRATEHFALTDSYSTRGSTSKEEPYDWFHINMIEKDESGNYLVSIRHLRTIAYISGTTGEVLWRLGGKHSSFTDLSNGEASLFVGQHDAHFHYEGDRVYITFFDNRADWQYELEHVSKGRRVALDLNRMTVEVDKTFVHPLNIFSFSQGSYQTLPNGHVLLGYGFSGAVTEFSANGKVLCDAYIQPSSRFSSGDVQSYRNMKFNWTGLPTTSPSLVLEQRTLYVSWLGATEVHSWELQHAYEETEEYTAAFTFEKSGFESSFQIEEDHLTRRYIKVKARDRGGEELAESVVIDLEAAGRSWMIKGQEEELQEDSMSVMLGHATGVLILICIAAMVWMLRTRPSWRAHLDSRGISTQSVKHEIRHRLSNMGILGGRQESRAHVAYDLLPTRHFEDE